MKFYKLIVNGQVVHTSNSIDVLIKFWKKYHALCLDSQIEEIGIYS